MRLQLPVRLVTTLAGRPAGWLLAGTALLAWPVWRLVSPLAVTSDWSSYRYEMDVILHTYSILGACYGVMGQARFARLLGACSWSERWALDLGVAFASAFTLGSLASVLPALASSLAGTAHPVRCGLAAVIVSARCAALGALVLALPPKPALLAGVFLALAWWIPSLLAGHLDSAVLRSMIQAVDATRTPAGVAADQLTLRALLTDITPSAALGLASGLLRIRPASRP